jgi:uncharacterized protein (DUF1778 family)
MKAPGVIAKPGGKPLKRGQALQVVCYPRPKTKAVLVAASRASGISLSSFLILAALKQAAALQNCEISTLITREELEQYARVKNR